MKREVIQMAEMLTKTLELVKIPAMGRNMLTVGNNYVVRHRCGHVEEINAQFWRDFIQHPYCEQCRMTAQHHHGEN